MHINVLRLEKAGLMESQEVRIDQLQKVVDMIFGYVMEKGRFPFMAEITGAVGGSSKSADIGFSLACLLRCGAIFPEDGRYPLRLNQEIKMDFGSDFVSMTAQEISEAEEALAGRYASGEEEAAGDICLPA